MKQIFLFAMPFLIGNLFQQFYNIADMVIVGRTLGTEAYAAVGATGSLVWFASGAIQALTVGFSVITARFFGAGNEQGLKRSFAIAAELSAIISAAMAILCTLFARPILELMRTPEDIIDRSYAYIVWLFAGLVATALFNLLSNMIRALGDSRTPLYFLIVACVINIILDFVFIAIGGMDTDGAGLATVLAQLISGICCLVYIQKKQPLLHLKREHFRVECSILFSLLHVGIPMAFLNMVLSVGSIVMQFVTNGLGTFYVSAQTTGAKMENFVIQPILSFGSSASVFTAQNYGAKQYKRVIAGGRKSLQLCFIWCIIASLIMIPFGKFFVSLLTGGNVEQEIIDNAYVYIVINTVLCFIVSPLVIYKSVLQSVERTLWTMVSGFTEILGRAGTSLVVIWLMNASLLDKATGYIAMCFANPLAWAFGLITVLPDYIFMVRALRKKSASLPEPQEKESTQDTVRPV